MSLRDDQRDLTRRKVLEAVVQLVADGGADDVTVPAVSERSGVSVATIYRYFPTKSALLDEAAWVPATDAEPVRPPRFFDEGFPRYLARLWKGFAANLDLARRQVASPAGREMRRARLEAGREQLLDELDELGVARSSPEAQRLVSLLLLLGGSLALLELHDRQGLPVDKAVAEVWWAATALVAATTAETARS